MIARGTGYTYPEIARMSQHNKWSLYYELVGTDRDDGTINFRDQAEYQRWLATR